MSFKTMVALVVFALDGMALTQSAHAGCNGKVIRETSCVKVGQDQFEIKFTVCGSFGGPVEVFLNGGLITTVPGPDDRPFRRELTLSGFGPGQYKIKGVNSRGTIKKKKIRCWK